MSSPKPIVAVTGASGFIASHIVDALLSAGYAVRAVVRDPSNEGKVAHLKAMAEGKSGTLEFASGDLLKAGSFDEAFQGAEVVMHTAAVVEVLNFKDAKKEIVDPAIEGTKNVLDSVDKCPSVKRVIYTSSCIAVQSFDKEDGYLFTEKDWNDWSTIENGDAYGYGKSQAEKLVHERAKGKPYTITCLNPGVVLGPVFCKAHTKASTSLVREVLYQNPMNQYLCSFVDARDVAQAHVKAIDTPAAVGERFLLVVDGPCMLTTDLGPIAERVLPEYSTAAKPRFSGVTFGVLSAISRIPGVGGLVMSEFQRQASTKPILFSNAHAKEVLGITFRSLDDTVRDSAKSMVDGGYIKAKTK